MDNTVPPIQPVHPTFPQSSPPAAPPSTVIPPTVPQTPTVGFPSPKKSNGFKIFTILSLLVLLSVWGVVGYLFYDNQKIENDAQNTSPTVIPTPTFSPREIQINNGNITRVTSLGESATLVSKTDYPETGITGFIRVVVSPNNTKLCFESVSPATTPALYISEVDGSGVTKISDNKNSCLWAPSGNEILFVNTPGTNLVVDIYKYNIVTKELTNLTETTQEASQIRQYAILSVEGSIAECRYDIVGKTGQKTNEGMCTIDINTGLVTDKKETE
jgi:hypothetical protein